MSTKTIAVWAFSALCGCGGAAAQDDATSPVGGKADSATPTAMRESLCDAPPDAGPRTGWRHFKSRFIALGSPHHRGIDLVTGAGAPTQALRGEMSYGLTDKAIEDEAVDLFACDGGAWRPLGSALTDDEGRFELDLSGGDRLEVGLRSLYVSLEGDRSGAPFLALVLPDGAGLAISDVDGTLTTSENAYAEALVTHAGVAAWPGAPAALSALRQRGYGVVYVTSRGRRFTQSTRDWLAQNGFPLGPVRLAASLITLPGASTVDYKAGVLQEFLDNGLTVSVGNGNRASDVEAYQRAGVAADQTFVKLPEFEGELQTALDAGEAVGFDDYRAIETVFAQLPKAP